MKPHLLALLLVACGGGGGETATGGPTAPTASTSSASTPGLKLAWSPDSRKVDKVGSGDGASSPDGQKDVVVAADVEGPAKALYVASVTSKGEPTGDYQADTLVGEEQPPVDLSLAGPSGKTTAGLFVYENDKLLNAADGSLRNLAPGPHKLTIYFADHTSLKEGIRLWVQRPDGSLATSSILR